MIIEHRLREKKKEKKKKLFIFDTLNVDSNLIVFLTYM